MHYVAQIALKYTIPVLTSNTGGGAPVLTSHALPVILEQFR